MMEVGKVTPLVVAMFGVICGVDYKMMARYSRTRRVFKLFAFPAKFISRVITTEARISMEELMKACSDILPIGLCLEFKCGSISMAFYSLRLAAQWGKPGQMLRSWS